MVDKPRQTGFSSCLWCDLRFSFRRGYTPGSENEFVDVETFSDIVPFGKLQLIPWLLLTLRLALPKLLLLRMGLLQSFTKDLERTVLKSGDPVENPSLVENREEIPEGQDPSPSVTAYNESFGMSLEVNC
jgi:hypothetical protein